MNSMLTYGALAAFILAATMVSAGTVTSVSFPSVGTSLLIESSNYTTNVAIQSNSALSSPRLTASVELGASGSINISQYISFDGITILITTPEDTNASLSSQPNSAVTTSAGGKLIPSLPWTLLAAPFITSRPRMLVFAAAAFPLFSYAVGASSTFNSSQYSDADVVFSIVLELPPGYAFEELNVIVADGAFHSNVPFRAASILVDASSVIFSENVTISSSIELVSGGDISMSGLQYNATVDGGAITLDAPEGLVNVTFSALAKLPASFAVAAAQSIVLGCPQSLCASASASSASSSASGSAPSTSGASTSNTNATAPVYVQALMCSHAAEYAGQILCTAGNETCGESETFISECTGDPRPPGEWVQGPLVSGASLLPGSAIATFADSSFSGHAAVFIGQTATGFKVYDQAPGRGVSQRAILWTGSGLANNGNSFYVIS